MLNSKPAVKPPVLVWDDDADSKTYAKVYLAGPSGGGKTRTAIEVAIALVGDESKIGVLNTEGASGAKVYKKLYPHLKIKTIDEPFSPKEFIAFIKQAPDLGIEAIIIDSASAEWKGVLSMVNSSTVANDFAKWKVPGALHDEFLAVIKSAPVHILATVRTKHKNAQVKGADGRVTVRKLPGSQIQRAEFDFEFDLGLVCSDAGVITVDKSHYDTLQVGAQFNREPSEIAKLIKSFLYPVQGD